MFLGIHTEVSGGKSVDVGTISNRLGKKVGKGISGDR